LRITDIDIHRFGAVEDFHLETATITVICGNNESGKTTILDALLEALFSVSARDVKDQFQGIDRYKTGTVLEGNVLVERRGILLTYPSSTGDTLDRLAGFPPVYIRNLLVVRESDIQFHDRDASWWSDIKDHLCGFEGGLEAVNNAILREVGLSADGSWVDEKGRRIGSEVSSLREAEQHLGSVQEDVEELARLRSSLRRVSMKREIAEKHLSLLKRARRKEQLETAIVLRRKLVEERQHVLELSGFDEAAHGNWRRLESEITAVRESIAGMEDQKNSAVARINATEQDASHWEEQARVWARKAAEILPEVETGLGQIKDLYEKERRLLLYQNFLVGSSVLLIALAALCLVFAIFRNAIWLLPTLTCIAAAAICGGLWFWRRTLSRRLALAKKSLLDRFQSYGEHAASVTDVESWVFTARQSSEQARGSAEALKHEAERERNELQQLSLSLDEKRDRLRNAEIELDSLRKEHACESIELFEARMEERTKAQDEVESLAGKVNILLGCGTEEEWDEQIQELEQLQDVETLWDENSYSRLELELPQLSEQEEMMREQTAVIEKRLLEAGCSSPEEAWHMKEDVSMKLLAYELDRHAAGVVQEIFDELIHRQDTIINTVLESGTDSATYYFTRVTSGRYNNIFWREGQLYVQTPNGKTLDIGALSTGARAQLHFSIRASLLQHLFGGESLFLLLDDPFLTSDRERVAELLKTLVEFTREGWQIVYFTVDREVAEGLKELQPDTVVKYLPRLDV
jgi:energy-coupling factor transporter ATP-binding protein EcfA2